ncbi:iron-sulfur cluster assembly protein [Mycobacterium paraintracellulare]|uniref:iron-sulfur cluster assembly protein n=1 Tax=Mycobacterium paraintracellulare TaxID=1138383 RepID=UPI001927BC5D|nr:iron-sulfur cluster assembly protein [Mycobacterium paraintracellulare]
MVATIDDLAEVVMAALHAVTDPELDEPITDLGFVRTVLIDDDGVEVHLRLPTAFCSPNFAYLMAADALDALRGVGALGRARVLLDDHHDSDKINAGLAADAGFVGTFGREAHDSLDELRRIFLRKAHTAAMERCVGSILSQKPLDVNALARLMLRDLPDGKDKVALLRRRRDFGLSMCPNSRVLVDEHGSALAAETVPMLLRFARTVRISMEGNSHFCRGLLATRYTDGGNDIIPEIVDARTRNPQ